MTKKFITFEGPEGSGKTSILRAVEKRLHEQGLDVVSTREPGGIRISELIRSIILDVDNKEMDARTEALLYAASRRQHIVEKIWPALKAGKIVLCDRFIDSSLAYQGAGRKLGIDNIYTLNRFAIEDTMPDLTFFIDVPPDVGLDRVFDNARKIDRLDLESIQFHKEVYKGYKELVKKFPKRIRVIDGNRKIEAVVDDVMSVLNDVL
ncbi:MAG: dTMP kinase [Bacillota bacterium]